MIERRDGPQTVSPSATTLRPRSPSEALEPTRAPQRPRGGKIRQPSPVLSAVARAGSALITLTLAALAITGGLALLLGHFYERPGPLAEQRTVVIERGSGRIEIAEQLERDGVISSRWAFVANHLMRNVLSGGKPLELKAGEYEIKAAASMRDVRELLGEGKSVLYKVTVPEGLTSQQIVERLNAETNLSGEITKVPDEGTLLPDTYRVTKGMSRQELIDQMQQEAADFIAKAWEARAPDLPISSPREALILASVVEKETGQADERHKVAAVFSNRLKKKMRLQSDPTIIYGIAGGRGSLGRPITRTDIDTKTDYNTYRINGLPPGPICNPGRETIEATLNPAKTNDLYFVADGTGGHTFSESLAAHNAAVQTWRKIEKTQAQEGRGTAGPGLAEADGDGAAPGDADEAAAFAGEAAATANVAAPAGKTSTVPLPVRKPKTGQN
jgi:UPF0755 protein